MSYSCCHGQGTGPKASLLKTASNRTSRQSWQSQDTLSLDEMSTWTICLLTDPCHTTSTLVSCIDKTNYMSQSLLCKYLSCGSKIIKISNQIIIVVTVVASLHWLSSPIRNWNGVNLSDVVKFCMAQPAYMHFMLKTGYNKKAIIYLDQNLIMPKQEPASFLTLSFSILAMLWIWSLCFAFHT